MNEKTKKIIDLRNQQKCYEDIAEELNTTYRSVQNVCQKYGVSYKYIENSWKNKVPKMRHDGMTYAQISEALNVDRELIEGFCRRNNLKYSDLNQSVPVHHCASYNKGKTLIDWTDKVLYVTGGKFSLVHSELLDTGERSLTVECTKCGFVKTVSSISIRANRGIRCNACSLMETEKRHRETQYRKKEETRLKKVRQSRQLHQMEIRFCSCGQVVPWGMKRCERCAELTAREQRIEAARRARQRNPEEVRRRERIREHKRRLRIESNGFDKTVDLNTLYKRDHGICYICGKVCDWSDFQKIDGNFIVGGTYPTVEHVKPLCKGGTHTWDNVKLACFACNTKKGRKSFDDIAPTVQR